MVVAVRNTYQSSYCSCCNRHFNSLEIPRDTRIIVPVSSASQHEMDKVMDEGDVGGVSWTSTVRPDVKLTSQVHCVTCPSCNARHRNPPYDYPYTEEKTNDVLVYGALLRLMGDMFQHRYTPDRR
ncbi:hypothetical protein LSAT2_007239 [Lamellibrachia satsuma]|nr:hypothetical protein LSAT2_007239 [Lamellibrachia satsuma]